MAKDTDKVNEAVEEAADTGTEEATGTEKEETAADTAEAAEAVEVAEAADTEEAGTNTAAEDKKDITYVGDRYLRFRKSLTEDGKTASASMVISKVAASLYGAATPAPTPAANAARWATMLADRLQNGGALPASWNEQVKRCAVTIAAALDHVERPATWGADKARKGAVKKLEAARAALKAAGLDTSTIDAELAKLSE